MNRRFQHENARFVCKPTFRNGQEDNLRQALATGGDAACCHFLQLVAFGLGTLPGLALESAPFPGRYSSVGRATDL